MSAARPCASARAPRRSRCGRRTTWRRCIRAQPGAPPVELVHIKTAGRPAHGGAAVAGRAVAPSSPRRSIVRCSKARSIIAVHCLKDLSTLLDRGPRTGGDAGARGSARCAPHPRWRAARTLCPPARASAPAACGAAPSCARTRPDLTLLELRGNVPTRLERLRGGQVRRHRARRGRACAPGARRSTSAQLLDPEVFPPAVSQGVIGRVRPRRGCADARVAARAR